VLDVRFEGGSSIVHVEVEDGPTLKARVLGLTENSIRVGGQVWVEIAGASVCLPVT
jgi:hypothetical protein